MIQDRRITDKLPGRPLQWEEGATPSAAPAADAPMPNAELERIAEEFRMHADSDDDAELRAGGEKRLIAFDYFKRGWITTKGAAPAAGQAGLAILEALRAYADPKNWRDDGTGIARVWWEPGSETPDCYAGFELASNAIHDAAPVAADTEQARIDAYVPGSWFDAQTIDEMQAFYMSRLPAIREAAREHGYAIGLHGSARRDFDLMAMQWREDASDKDTLARAIADAACGIRREGAYDWEQKPSGRFAVSIPVCWTAHDNPDFDKPSVGHIDLSVIATPADAGAGLNLTDGRIRSFFNEREFFPEELMDPKRFYNSVREIARLSTSGAPVTAEPVAWGLLEIQEPELTNDRGLAAYWARKGRNVTPLYTAAAPAPADRDAIRDQALEEIAKWYGETGWLLDEEYVEDAIRALKSMERAADAKGDAK